MVHVFIMPKHLVESVGRKLRGIRFSFISPNYSVIFLAMTEGQPEPAGTLLEGSKCASHTNKL